MKKFLEATEIVDWKHPSVKELAAELACKSESRQEIARRCFEWVRDRIRHSMDYQLNPVTCKASEVLLHKTGFCYAKSHLLAALLRANNIPAGFCYQRLSRDDNWPPFCLHGLNAVYLEEFGWYRVDARGNKAGFDAQFCPPTEQLAFIPKLKGEADLPGIRHAPLQAVIDVLNRCKSYEEVNANLPDAGFDF